MTSFVQSFQRLIRTAGPQPVSRLMAEAVGHYYASHSPFGAAGDFVTAPEVSQMFGELLGLWTAETWRRMGCPNPLLLVEFGPGRGKLMQDALRAARLVPGFLDAIELHLVETSPRLRALQAAALKDQAPVWHDRIAALPSGPMIAIANEFFDALPIRQFVHTKAGWRERLVGIQGNALAFVAAIDPLPPSATLPAAFATAPLGAIAEVCPAGETVAMELANRITAFGGAALIIDYGATPGVFGDTLQAIRRHRRESPLLDPGEADLSAQVDFAALARVAGRAGARIYGPLPQGVFLRRLGIDQRAVALAKGATAEKAEKVWRAHHRLTAAEGMGELFKVLSLTHPALAVPAGFETEPAEKAAP